MRDILIGALFLVSACTPPAVEESNTQTAAEDTEADKLERWVDELRERETLNLDNARIEPTAVQIDTFGPLTALVGKSFRGNPMGDSSEPNPDTQTWEWALGGTAILIRHALADGSYGGDTYVYKDSSSGDLVYVYITNAGFRTEGTMTVNEDGSYTAVEAVSGHPEIVEVRSTSTLNEDGSTSMSSEYVTSDGTVNPGHSFTYQPTTEPLPALRAPAPRQ